MRTRNLPFPGPARAGLGIALALALPALAAAPLRAEDFVDWKRGGVLTGLDLSSLSAPAASPAAQANRLRLFRLMPGFLSDPVGLEADDPTPPASPPGRADDDLNWLQVSMGNDNPFFDFRRPGDPGGVGFYKVHTQVQLLDSPSTCFALGLQAVTPAGLQNGGVDDGPTVVVPALSLFHSLDDGTAFHGFVGKNVNCDRPLGGSSIHRSFQYGVAVQRPVAPAGPEGLNNLYLFVEALGRYRYDASAAAGPAALWEVLPGLQWKVNPNWWISGGVSLPVNAGTPDARLWQITCSFQF